MNWKTAVIQKVGNKKYSVATRIKVGRAINIVAALPLGTSWMFLIGIPLSSQLEPSVYFRSKRIDFQQWRGFR